MVERIKDIHLSYEFQNFTIEELQKIKLIYELKYLELKIKEMEKVCHKE